MVGQGGWMRLYRKILLAAAALLVVGLAVLVGLEKRAHRTPLGVGATADEAWAYVHSPAAWGSRGALVDIAQSGWTAHALDIQCDMKHYFHTGTNRHLFATRRAVYVLGTNGTITGMRSHWKVVRPF